MTAREAAAVFTASAAFLTFTTLIPALLDLPPGWSWAFGLAVGVPLFAVAAEKGWVR